MKELSVVIHKVNFPYVIGVAGGYRRRRLYPGPPLWPYLGERVTAFLPRPRPW